MSEELATIEGLSYDENIIVIEQMPIIAQQLEAMKPKIEAKVAEALAMECTDENIKTVKKMRAELNKISATLEKRRIAIKTQYMTSYDAMAQTFGACITEPFRKADNELKRRIDALEREKKDKIESEIKTYFMKYAESAGIDIPYDRAGINVTLSASMKSLKDKACNFIDKRVVDRTAILQMDNADEIMVEYEKTYDLARSISIVTERHKALEAQHQAREAAQEHGGYEGMHIVPVHEEPKVTAELAPDTDASLFTGFGLPQQSQPVPKGMVTAIITIIDTPERIQMLEQTLLFGGYEYGLTYSDNR